MSVVCDSLMEARILLLANSPTKVFPVIRFTSLSVCFSVDKKSDGLYTYNCQYIWLYLSLRRKNDEKTNKTYFSFCSDAYASFCIFCAPHTNYPALMAEINTGFYAKSKYIHLCRYEPAFYLFCFLHCTGERPYCFLNDAENR